MDSAWVGVIGSLGGVFLTSAIGLAGATVNNRWQDRTRSKEREERLHESRASLRRDAYARLLIASDKVEDFLLSQPPGEHGDIDTLEQAAERLRELWARGDGHMFEYGSALTLSRLLAGSEVVDALEEFSEWMDEQFALAVMEPEPLGGAAFDDGDEKRKPLIEAMRSEQENDLLQDPVETRMGRMTEDGIDRPEHARELAIQRLKMKQDFKGVAAGGAFAVLVCIVIWALGGGGYFWPVWVILGIGIAVVAQGWKAYGPSNRITEADVQREMERG